MSQFFGGQFFGGDLFAASSTSGDFFGGPFFNGNFFEAAGTGGNYYNGPFYNGGFFGDFNAPPAEIIVDTVDGRKRDQARREFEQRQDDWKADLRRVIERAFEQREEVTQAAPVEPLAKPDKRKMAQGILAQTNFGPLQLSLSEIIRPIDEYQRALVIERMRRDEEDAILLLMLAE